LNRGIFGLICFVSAELIRADAHQHLVFPGVHSLCFSIGFLMIRRRASGGVASAAMALADRRQAGESVFPRTLLAPGGMAVRYKRDRFWRGGEFFLAEPSLILEIPSSIR
jgi:hypothetical protein